MKPNPKFLNQPKPFWACVRHISQDVGYTVRGKGEILVPTLEDICCCLSHNGLNPLQVVSEDGDTTDFGKLLLEYFRYRAETLNTFVEPRLMNGDQAKAEFKRLKAELNPTCPVPMNKQKGAKKAPAYLTGMVNMLVQASTGKCPCDFDPRCLTTITKNGMPLRTLARRVDGAFPSTVNPIAIWEIKEYYYTTTFGSRVADGVYETLLDGMELAELREHEGIHVLHYLFIDAHYTWWRCGRSYLCRIIDTLHMGYIDEVLFGSEVAERLPAIARQWAALDRKRTRNTRSSKPPKAAIVREMKSIKNIRG